MRRIGFIGLVVVGVFVATAFPAGAYEPGYVNPSGTSPGFVSFNNPVVLGGINYLPTTLAGLDANPMTIGAAPYDAQNPRWVVGQTVTVDTYLYFWNPSTAKWQQTTGEDHSGHFRDTYAVSYPSNFATHSNRFSGAPTGYYYTVFFVIGWWTCNCSSAQLITSEHVFLNQTKEVKCADFAGWTATNRHDRCVGSAVWASRNLGTNDGVIVALYMNKCWLATDRYCTYPTQ